MSRVAVRRGGNGLGKNEWPLLSLRGRSRLLGGRGEVARLPVNALSAHASPETFLVICRKNKIVFSTFSHLVNELPTALVLERDNALVRRARHAGLFVI